MVDIKIDTPQKNSDNKGSCNIFVCHYMSKEDLLKGMDKMEFWINHSNNMVSSYEVQQSIDGNHMGLGKNESKFFTGSINPSQSEWKHINNDPEKLKQYGLEFFKLYAENFNRNIDLTKLIYHFKLESNRYFKGDDPLVKNGQYKQGDIKPGNNQHLHFIVSRLTRDGKKISPKTNHRQATDSGVVNSSFNRDALFQKSEELFDRMFSYNRPISESYRNLNSIKNGSPDERRIASQQNVDIELCQTIFIASSPEKKIQIIKDKIEQINNKLKLKNIEQLNEKELFHFEKSALNGKTYYLLQNFEQLLDNRDNSVVLKPNELIIDGIKSTERSILLQSGKMLQCSINSFTQIINQELTKSFSLKSTDIIKDAKQLNYSLLNCLGHGACEKNRELLLSIIGNEPDTNSGSNSKVKENIQPLINEVNVAYTGRGSHPEQKLTAGFLSEIQDHYSEDRIKIALLAVKGIVKTNPDFNEIRNLNLFLFSILVHWSKKYNEFPSALKLQRLKFYADFLNSRIKGKIFSKIDIDQVLKAEIESNYSGKTLAYLNAINSKIKKEDFLGAETLINLSPQEFIENKKSASSNSGASKNEIKKPKQSSHAKPEFNEGSRLSFLPEPISFLPDVSSLLADNQDDENWDDKKRKRKKLTKRRRPN